jgi:hypothetical protein
MRNTFFIMKNSSTTTNAESNHDISLDETSVVHEARVWIDKGWTARVIKNDDDEGWAVAMYIDGQSEPALVGPWTMGRDKKNPKPLDVNAFHTLIKTASEVIRRHEQALHASLHKSVFVSVEDADLRITLEIVPDDDDPYAVLRAHAADASLIAEVKVAAGFSLTKKSALAWVENEFKNPNH